MRMKESFDKGVDEHVSREEIGGTLAPVGAELGVGDGSIERKGWGVPVGTKERMMNLKRRKHMDDVEVQSMKVPANVQKDKLSDPDQGGQIVNTSPQIQGLTAINHNQGTRFVKIRSRAELEGTGGGQAREEEQGRTLRKAEGASNLTTTRQLPGIHTIQPRPEWVESLNVQKRRARRIERESIRKAKEAKKWALRIPKKPLSPEEKRERNRRKADRHKTLKTPQMIADDKESRQKLWKGELAQLPKSRGIQFRGQSGPVS